MLESLIALLGIFFGIIGANLFASIAPDKSLGFTANTLIGVFGSVFFIKSFGRLGFSPPAIVQNGNMDLILLATNLSVSFFGAILFLLLFRFVTRKYNLNVF